MTSLIIDSLFLLCPTGELPLLAGSARLDLLDYHAAGMEAKATNRLGGETRLLEKTDSLITLQLTHVSRWTMRLTPQGLLRVEHSIQAAPNWNRTSTRFYNKDWELEK